MRKLPIMLAVIVVLLGAVGATSAMGMHGNSSSSADDASQNTMTEECAEWMEENEDASMSECMNMMSNTDTMSECQGMMNMNSECMGMMSQMGGDNASMGCH